MYAMTNLTADETRFLTHISMWGSLGYPIVRMGRKWWVTDFCGISGVPVPFKTKAAAAAHVEAYLAILRDKHAGRFQVAA